MIAEHGRDLQLEYGSLSSVLRWEKRTEVLCMLIEGESNYVTPCELSRDVDFVRNANEGKSDRRVWENVLVLAFMKKLF